MFRQNTYSLAGSFEKERNNRAYQAPMTSPATIIIELSVTPILLKISFNRSRRGMVFFLLPHPPKSQAHRFFLQLFPGQPVFRRRSVLIIDNFLIYFIFAFKFIYAVIYFFSRFCAVKVSFKSVYLIFVPQHPI